MSGNLKAKRIALLKSSVTKWNRYMRFCFNVNEYFSVDLRGVDLQNTSLQYANLRFVDMWNANLRFADLRYANLWGANIRGVNLWNASLRDTDLRFADLLFSELRFANLHGTDLRKTKGIFVIRGICEYAIIAHRTNLQIGHKTYSWKYWEKHIGDEKFKMECFDYDIVYEAYKIAKGFAKNKGWI